MLTVGRQFLAIILEDLAGKILSVNKVGVRMIAAKGATCGDLSTCLLAQAILTRKLTNRSFLTHRMTETTVCILYSLFASLGFVMEQRCCLSCCTSQL